MKFTKKVKAACLLIISFSYLNTFTKSPLVAPYYNLRSQGSNSARHAVGWVSHIHSPDENCAYGLVSFTPEFTQSFNAQDINRCLFNEFLIDGSNTLKISGSRVPNRSSQDLLADYFYLPTDYESTVSLNPQIENFLVDFGLYVDLSQWTPGLYFEAFAPLVHTRWCLNFDEDVESPGVNNHEAGYFTPFELDRKLLFNSFTQYINGDQLESVTQDVPNANSIRTVFRRLNAGRMDSKRRQQTRVADIRTTIGWNCFIGEVSHVGFGFTVSAPTGNRVHGKYLFEPIVGNGHSWEFGGKLHSLFTFWQSADYERELHWYTDAYITHLFKAEQRRTFDFKNNGNLSRYMLAEKLTPESTGNLIGTPSGQAPLASFSQEFIPAANFTRQQVAVGVAIQADITTMITYTSPCWEIDAGYNFWAQSRQGVQSIGDVELASTVFVSLVTAGSPFESQLLRGLKGDAHVYGYTDANTPVALSATESNATINTGTNFVEGQSITDARRNPNIDNPQQAAVNPGAVPLSPTPNPIDPPINTSIEPVTIRLADIAINESGTTALSHKVFAHISYTWHDRQIFTPYFGVGGEAEFGSNKMSSVKDFSDCMNGPRCSISQWGVWAKGGIIF